MNAARASSQQAGAARTIRRLWQEVQACTRCPLYANATQGVLGEGPVQAEVFFIGEQPGDQEDLQGRPFVGPAGRMLDKAMAEAGIDRSRVYITNAVKHFKWEPRGKARIHKKPNASEIAACRPWLDREIALVRPKGILCLGATAAQALLGRSFRVTTQRGRAVESPLAPVVMATVHPSSLLRAPTDADRERETNLFIEDLKRFAAALVELGRSRARRSRAHAGELRTGASS